MRILVTGGDKTGGLAAVRALRAAGHEPWTAAATTRAYAARSRAAAGMVPLPDSSRDPAGYIAELEAAIGRLDLQLVIPGTERDLIAISRERDRLMPAAAGIPDLATVRRATDKAAVYELARQAGLKVPATARLDDGGQGPVAELGQRFPVVVKPRRSEHEAPGGGLVHADVLVVDSPEALRRLQSQLAPDQWLVQERVDGELGAVSGLAWEGEVINALHQRADRVWPPGAGVSAYARTVEADPPLEAAVGRLIGSLDWSGIFQAQFIYTREGPKLIDLNPRVYGSLALSTAAGVNLPGLWAALAAGSAVDRSPFRVGVRYRAEELDPRALLRLALQGRPLAALLGALPHRHTTHAVMRLADPLPGLTSLAKLAPRRGG